MMLVLSGIAESTCSQSDILKGQTYSFNLFCQNEVLDEQLELIEGFMNKKGWDNIVINEQEFIDDKADISHEVLLNAFHLAEESGISGVFNKTPVAF